MYQDAFLTVEFRTNWALCNQCKKGEVLKFGQKFQFWYIVPLAALNGEGITLVVPCCFDFQVPHSLFQK